MTKITYIPGEIANAAIDEQGNRKPVTRTHHIFDDNLGKPQSEVNQDRTEDVATLDGKIAAEKTRAEGVEAGLNERLEQFEELVDIQTGEVEAQVTTSAADIKSGGAKLPTAGAVHGALLSAGYFTCDTAAATAAKIVSATGYALRSGGSMKIKMTNANTADNATLNINSTGAKALYYAGERASASNSWEAGETVEVYYDGTNFMANNVAGGSGSGDINAVIPSVNEEGFHVIDKDLNVGMKYDADGFDVAKVSSHFIEVLKAAGVSADDVMSSHASLTNEDGFFITDEELNIGVKVNSDGIHAKNILEYEIIED